MRVVFWALNMATKEPSKNVIEISFKIHVWHWSFQVNREESPFVENS